MKMKWMFIVMLLVCVVSLFLGGCVIVPTSTGMEIDLANAEVQAMADKCQDVNNPTACEDCKAMSQTLRVKSQRFADIANGRKVVK